MGRELGRQREVTVADPRCQSSTTGVGRKLLLGCGSGEGTAIRHVVETLGIKFGMAEIHAGTAAGVHRAVFPLAGGAPAKAKLGYESLAVRGRAAGVRRRRPTGRVFFGEACPRSSPGCAGPLDGSMGILSRTKPKAAGAVAEDGTFTESERMDALWRLTALPRSDFDAASVLSANCGPKSQQATSSETSGTKTVSADGDDSELPIGGLGAGSTLRPR